MEMMDDVASQLALAEFVKRNDSTIINAMRVYAERMRDAATVAKAEWQRGQDDLKVKAAQDASLITNSGYRMAAELAADSADTAKRVVEELMELIEAAEQD